MIPISAAQLALITGGTYTGEEILVMSHAAISSKNVTQGSLFAAFRGAHVDGHDYIEDAFSNGAVLALVTHPVPFPHVLVSDVQKALADIASYVRRELKDLRVVAITGSQGKTTTKELLASILKSHFQVVSPEGNLNNELGVPLTILQCDSNTQVCIVEMGARHIGDIAHLTNIAQPNVGAVLRVAAAHIGEFGSIENIALAKSELIQGLNENAVAILGTYDSYTEKMASLHANNVVTFGEKNTADVRAADIEMREGKAHFDLVTKDGRNPVALRLVGMHQVSNALAAAAIASALGLSNDQIATGLSIAESHAPWRMEIHEFEDLILINDAYNASPDSMAAALTTLRYFAQEQGGESWAFLGLMRELGEVSEEEHRKIGVLAEQLGIDHLVTVSAPAYGAGLAMNSSISLHACTDMAGAREVAEHINPGDVVLFKASRSEHFEVLAQEIEEMWKGKTES